MISGRMATQANWRLGGLDLAPLYQDCILKSHERRETYDAIAGELCDYGLEWGGSLVEARAFRCRAQAISVYSMRYGDEVRIRPDLYRDFVLAHVSVHKGIEIETDGNTYHVPEGRVFFSAPKRSIALRWQEGCEQVLVRIPHRLLFGEEPGSLPRSAALLPDPLVAPFAHQLSALLAMARQPLGLYGFGLWQETLQASLSKIAARSLGVSDEPAVLRDRSQSRTSDRLDRLETFIHDRLDRPISLSDLEASVHLGRSQLNHLVQQAFGCSPMMLVRRRRLEALRQSLETNPAQDLTQLSLRYGFDHQGRFSHYYKEHFGEAPSETRRRLRGLPVTGKNG